MEICGALFGAAKEKECAISSGILISTDKHKRKPTGKQRAKRKQKARKSKRTGEITYGNDGDGDDGGDDARCG